MQFASTSKFLGLGLLISSLLLAACGQIEVGLDQTATPPVAGEISETEPSSSQNDGQDGSTSPSLPPLVHNAQAPEMISIGPYVPAVSTDIGMVVREENQISLQNSPVDFGLFWGYTPVTGRLAYSSEFWGPSATYGFMTTQPVKASSGWKPIWALPVGRLMASIWRLPCGTCRHNGLIWY